MSGSQARVDGVAGVMDKALQVSTPPVYVQHSWPRQPGRLLLVSANWLGDVIMALPALQTFRSIFPKVQITVLARPPLDDIWRMTGLVADARELPKSLRALKGMASSLKQDGYDSACLLPNSFRSALLPWMARIPHRRGVAGQLRTLLLTDPLPQWHDDSAHQLWESARLLGLGPSDLNDFEPRLAINSDEKREIRRKFQVETAVIALIPGAARGAVKRWPAAHFVKAAQLLRSRGHDAFVVLGTAAERVLCETVAAQIGPGARSLAGETSLREFVVLLAASRAVVCNDSGGMHLASAAGTPLVAVFGITDPMKTGPLGGYSRVVALPGVRHGRDVPRDSAEARDVLRKIEPERVVAELEALLGRAP